MAINVPRFLLKTDEVIRETRRLYNLTGNSSFKNFQYLSVHVQRIGRTYPIGKVSKIHFFRFCLFLMKDSFRTEYNFLTLLWACSFKKIRKVVRMQNSLTSEYSLGKSTNLGIMTKI